MTQESPFRDLNAAAKVGVIILCVFGLVAAAGVLGLLVWGAGWVWQQAIGAWT